MYIFDAIYINANIMLRINNILRFVMFYSGLRKENNGI